MANYVASTFIYPYLSTSRTLRILDATGKIIFSINVCNYQKSLVVGSNLSIVLEDNNKEYLLDFANNTEAKTALVLFKSAVDTLRPNCAAIEEGGGPTGSPAPISINYDDYKLAASGATLIPLQWYDVVDVTGEILSPGTTMRLLAISTTDAYPRGLVLDSTNANIAVDTFYNLATFYELPQQRATFLNCTPNNISLDTFSSDIIGLNGGSIVTTTSSRIKVDNSVVFLNGCSNMDIKNSNIVLNNAQNVSLDGILQDFTTFTFDLIDVDIDRNDSIGKVADRAELDVTQNFGNVSLDAYFDSFEQNITLNSDSNISNVTLDNKIPQANAEFRLRYIGTGITNTINILDKTSANIFTITDAQKGHWLVFRYNKVTQLFEFVNLMFGDGSTSGGVGVSVGGTAYYVSPVFDNQTSFILPVPAVTAASLEMFINGQKKIFGLDFTYTSIGQTVTYLNRDFPISATDEVDFIIY